MDPRDNPYTPNAGAQPPVLAGREDELTNFDLLLARLERGATEQSMIITGLRGVGKTVLLGAFRSKAEARRWATAEAEITKNSEFGANIGQLARAAPCSRSRRAPAGRTAPGAPPRCSSPSALRCVPTGP